LNRWIVDASVAFKWLLPEIHTEAAFALLEGDNLLLVPDLIYAEVGNALWKQVVSGTLDNEEAQAFIEYFDQAPLISFPIAPLLPAAVQIACSLRRTVYDSLYLALAIREESILVTADRKFYSVVAESPLASYARCVDEESPGV
jgi:predicted nucleic acid-binding protein